MIESYEQERALLAEIALQEGKLKLRGDANKAGSEIEKYLSIFRDAFNTIDNTTKYSDKSLGFEWCCAFVYYCCTQAGFSFPVKPILSHRSTLGVVSVWYDWANLPENQFYHSAHAINPMPGDIDLFDCLLEKTNSHHLNLDHLGIVIDIETERIITAEGNFENRSGTF